MTKQTEHNVSMYISDDDFEKLNKVVSECYRGCMAKSAYLKMLFLADYERLVLEGKIK